MPREKPRSRKTKAAQEKIELNRELKREIAGLVGLAAGIMGFLALSNPSGGFLGGLVKSSLTFLLGSGAYALALFACLGGLFLLLRRKSPPRPAFWVGGLLLFTLYVTTAAALAFPPPQELQELYISLGGGLIGNGLAYLAFWLLGVSGRDVAGLAIFAVGVVLVANASWIEIIGKSQRLAVGGAKGIGRGIKRGGEFLSDFILEEVAEVEEVEPVADQEELVHSQTAAGTGLPALPTGGSVAAAPAVPAPSATLPAVLLDPPRSRPYVAAPTSLLQRGNRGVKDGRSLIEAKERVLEETLESFGVKGQVVNVEEGPVITRFEVQLPPGIKVSRIVGLADNIALAMAAVDVRIEAPVPGKGVVGIEIPNRETSSVRLRDVLESSEFVDSPSALTVGLGKDIAGRPVTMCLDQMPHLLIAGATDSGKSVCLNAIIASLLCKAKPEELKLLLIDPKMVELSVFNGLPHLLAPVVTNSRQAAKILHWAVREMEQRYDALATAGVRDITRFNAAALKNGTEPMPYIVLVIDELADLMMISPREVEETVCRLAQMARAAGMHLVVATQRPSVDVITGLIKANIPSRIAFAVSSQVDSRTILDTGGAERLLGKGDMLYYPMGASKPTRVQGAFVSEKEVEILVEFHRQQGTPAFTEELLADVGEEGEAKPEEVDELFPAAVKTVVEAGQASVSFLQRKLRIGYTRAARLVDAMEERNFVGPPDGSKPREVRLSQEGYRQLFPEDT